MIELQLNQVCTETLIKVLRAKREDLERSIAAITEREFPKDGDKVKVDLWESWLVPVEVAIAEIELQVKQQVAASLDKKMDKIIEHVQAMLPDYNGVDEDVKIFFSSFLDGIGDVLAMGSHGRVWYALADEKEIADYYIFLCTGEDGDYR